MREDGIEIYDMLKREKNCETQDIISFGRSIGSGVASHLATKRPVGCLILQSPYTSIRDLTKEKIGFLAKVCYCCIPEALNFQNSKNLAQIDCPLLMIHGKIDELIPYQHSEKLLSIAKSPQKKLDLRETMSHNRYNLENDLVRRINEFLVMIKF